VAELTLYSHILAYSTDGFSITTANLDTFNTTFIIVAIADYDGVAAATLSDNQSNTWTPLTPKDDGIFARIALFYCKDPITSASHTFTANSPGGGFPSIAVQSWTGEFSSKPFSSENGNTASSGNSLQPGAVYPPSKHSMIVTALANLFGSGAGIDSGFTISDSVDNLGNNTGLIMAYKQSNDLTAQNPTISYGSSTDAAATIAVFNAAFLDSSLLFLFAP